MTHRGTRACQASRLVGASGLFVCLVAMATSPVARFVGGGVALRQEFHERTRLVRERSRAAAEAFFGGVFVGDGVDPLHDLRAAPLVPVGVQRRDVRIVARGDVNFDENVDGGAEVHGLQRNVEAGGRADGAVGAPRPGLLARLQEAAGTAVQAMDMHGFGSLVPPVVRRAADGTDSGADARLESELERLQREDLNLMGGVRHHRAVDDVVADAINALPVPAQDDRTVSDKLRAYLAAVDRSWCRFLDESPGVEDGFCAPYDAPSWEDTVKWVRWLLLTLEVTPVTRL